MDYFCDLGGYEYYFMANTELIFNLTKLENSSIII
jgi:hypothetical protein